MSLADVILTDRDDVLLREDDGQTVTAIQLRTGQSFTAIFNENSSERDQKYGVANTVNGALWVPITARPQQQEQWSIIRNDNMKVEVTVISFGARSGGLMEVKVDQLTVARFKGAGVLT